MKWDWCREMCVTKRFFGIMVFIIVAIKQGLYFDAKHSHLVLDSVTFEKGRRVPLAFTTRNPIQPNTSLFAVQYGGDGCHQIGQNDAQTQIATYDVRLKNLMEMQKGLGWPNELLVTEGQEGLMKLTVTLNQPHSCIATTPAGVAFDVTSPPNNRYEHWSDGCGLRLRHVEMSDAGRWRLSATQGTETIEGWIELSVGEDVQSYTPPPISLNDGETQTQVDLTTLDNTYCVVTQPFSQSSLVPGHCQVTLERTTRAVQGNWNILIGIPGRISELRVDRHVGVEAERLDVGYVHDSNTNKVHLYCNIQQSSKNITFCRFQKTTATLGFNVMEGLSDGTHSYYGNGFVAKECGMTIENPTPADYGTWRCSVGSQHWVGDVLQQQTPMQALINVMQNHHGRQERDVRSETEERTVFVQEGLSFTVMCQADMSLSYCWFLHPNGSQFSPLPQTSEDQLFWYTGQSLQFGECGITFTHANVSDAGNWVCHMGATNHLGVEETDVVNVRVTGPLAASKKNLEVVIGKNTTIHCHTSNGNWPLDYCRFLSPNYVGINIDSSITRENAIMDRFYFPNEHSLNYGDCSLGITSVKLEDLGTWTCAALINDEIMEASDTVEVLLSTNQPRLSRAGIAGMSIGIIALLALLAGVVWYKIGKPVPFRRTRDSQQTQGVVPFDMMSMTTSARFSADKRSSASSSGSSAGSDSGRDDGKHTVQIASDSRTPGVVLDPLTVPGPSSSRSLNIS